MGSSPAQDAPKPVASGFGAPAAYGSMLWMWQWSQSLAPEPGSALAVVPAL